MRDRSSSPCRFLQEAHDYTADAVLGRLSARKSCLSNDFEHLSIVVEHMRDKLSDTTGTRNIGEPLQEQRAGAAILIVICDGGRKLRTLAAGRGADEAAHRN